ncbi:MAG TPA: UDP-N-acetylmuramoyl-tripeptide--D-alanyl-D-alanine ligase [Baekduia sp.]|uniref:UDP-N-acetylmuramoyl-tripeptide--D-alanyl-D- alanine ligase n=1 Tax=Baekduia sp. TaxID=2600305 RepID=UPI002BDE3CC6|nr:UDP-N-acetylmuramoyl-tripeptide--D-alanyl-D-alanine ligase [Baekduia sp.]HMJ34036.1 UDP-N-acetylmuramoyl-tripeptide--D-alanyl-D-alanine ligase [Baekduia sp.]
MRDWTPDQVAEAAGARLVEPGDRTSGPTRAVIDSRQAGSGDLFVGLPGERVDGGRFADAVLGAGAWGVLVGEGWGGVEDPTDGGGAVLVAQDPLAALQRLATAWRRELGAQVIGVTGSTGKTSTKDLLAAMVDQQRRVIATPLNLNTEIGLPLTVLSAPAGTEVLVLEMAMRGAGQIAELAAIAEPDVGIVVNVGPVHLELLGSVEAIAAAKAELLDGLKPGGTAIVPAGEPLLEGHRTRDDVSWVTFGPGGDVDALPEGLEITAGGDRLSAHMRANALAALAAARAIGVEPTGRLEVALSELRGQRVDVGRGIVVIDDCYNANPMSMRAALDDLAASEVDPPARRVAVLGDMLELGPGERRFHEEIGAHARVVGVDLLVTVGPLAEAMGPAFGGEVRAVATAADAVALLPGLLQDGDTVLVKGSRGVGLEVVAQGLTA